MSLRVTEAESNLLTVARAAVGIVPAHEMLHLLPDAVAAPDTLGPSARTVLEDTLARGTVWALAREGGWLPLGGRRVWERGVAPVLSFTASLVTLFRWVLQSPLKQHHVRPLELNVPLTAAEELVATLLVERLRQLGLARALLAQSCVAQWPLVRLAHVVALAEEKDCDAPLHFSVQRTALFVEGLRHFLAKRWLEDELALWAEPSAEGVLRKRRAQALVLDAWFSAIDAAGRRDLATFVIDTAVEWMKSPVPMPKSPWPQATWRVRSEALQASGEWFRAVRRLHRWDEEHRAVRFFDDGYEQAQALISDWQRLGERGFAAVRERLDALETLFSVVST